jgi:hypothetical protein
MQGTRGSRAEAEAESWCGQPEQPYIERDLNQSSIIVAVRCVVPRWVLCRRLCISSKQAAAAAASVRLEIVVSPHFARVCVWQWPGPFSSFALWAFFRAALFAWELNVVRRWSVKSNRPCTNEVWAFSMIWSNPDDTTYPLQTLECNTLSEISNWDCPLGR